MLTPEQQAADQTSSIEKLWELAQQSVELARIISQNSCADPQLLRELAASSDSEVRRGVAGNPNVPVDVLFKLGEQFPKQLLENPSLSLLLLENPNFLDDLPLPAVRSILQEEHIPTFFLNWAINQRRIDFSTWLAKQRGTPDRLLVEQATRAIPERSEHWCRFLASVIRNPNTPNDVLEIIAARNDRLRDPNFDEIDLILVARANFSQNIIEILAVRGSLAAKIEIAKQPETSAALLRKLAENRSETWLLCAIAQNPNTPEDILEELILHDRSPYYVKHSVALNPNLCDRIVFLLLEKYDLDTQTRLQTNLHLSTTALAQLAKSSNHLHQWFAATHPNTPMSTLMDWLKNNSDFHVFLAQNPAMPEEIIREFLISPLPYVREAVASNPSTPETLLMQLSTDCDDKVRQAARKNLEDEAKNIQTYEMPSVSPDLFW